MDDGIRGLRHWRIRHRSCGLHAGSLGVLFDGHSLELRREGFHEDTERSHHNRLRSRRICRQIHLTRDSFSTCLTLCTHHIVAQGVFGAHSLHLHVIHDVTCLSVCCFLALSSSSSPSPASTFSFTVYLFSVLFINFRVVGTAKD